MTVKSKLIIAFGLICVGLAAITMTGYSSLKSVVEKYSQLSDKSVPKLGDISGLRARASQNHSNALKLVVFSDNAEEFKKSLEDLQKGFKRYQEIREEYLGRSFFSDAEKEAFDKMDVHTKPIVADLGKVITLASDAKPENIAAIKDVLSRFEEHARPQQKLLKELDDVIVAAGEQWSAEAKDVDSKARAFLLITAGLTMLAAVVISTLLSRSISNSLNEVALRLSQGAQAVFENSTVLKNASASMSASVTEQAAALQETLSATDEVSATIQTNSDNAALSVSKTELMQQSSTRGRESIQELLASMEEIEAANQDMKTQVERSNSEISQIIDLINHINEKTRVIHDIVFQTKLLSFNASVEAARAGESGKGFAVVAEEVGNLAKMSGTAAQEIGDLLDKSGSQVKSIIEKASSTVDELVKSSESKVGAGREKARLCDEVFSEIAENIDIVTDMARQIAVASQEQAAGVNEISKAMAQVDTVTSQNSQSAEQCSQISNELQAQVDATRDVVSDLFKIVFGKGHPGAAAVNSEKLATVHEMKKRDAA